MRPDRPSSARQLRLQFHLRHLSAIRLVLPILLLSFANRYTVPVLGQQPPSGGNPNSRVANPSPEAKADARSLVEALVNRNPAPHLVGPEHCQPIFDKTFDWAENQRVWDAVPVLIRRAESAWPELVRHLDDDRYCMTLESWSGFTYNWTVGKMCHEIVSRNMAEAYYRNIRPLTKIVHLRLSRPEVANNTTMLKSWCQKRSAKRLYELQIESCQWAITELKAGVLDDQLPQLPQREWIAAIEAEIESLQASKKAVPFKGFGGEEQIPYSRQKAEKSREEFLKRDDQRSRAKKP